MTCFPTHDFVMDGAPWGGGVGEKQKQILQVSYPALLRVLRHWLQRIREIDFLGLWPDSYLLAAGQIWLDRVGVCPIQFPAVFNGDDRVVSRTERERKLNVPSESLWLGLARSPVC